jgi:F-type H+-transporting ATPase subunit alpha
MTDGHILFSANLRSQGIYPAIEPDRSVTRVGRQTQTFIHKVLSDRVRLMLAEYHELERYGRFGSELSAETQLKIKRGKVIEELLKQEPMSSIPPEGQILMLSLVYTGFFDKMDLESLRSLKKNIISTLQSSAYKVLADAVKTAKLDDLITQLKGQLKPLEDICTPKEAPVVSPEAK